MPLRITNEHAIDLPLAVWLLQDGYSSGAKDAPKGELISVTSLMKPVRQQILQRKIDINAESMDISSRVSQRMGHALHDSIERAWTSGSYKYAMKQMGYLDEVIDSIKINPDLNSLTKKDIPVFLEQRGFKEYNGIVITGQLDFSINYAYRDVKSTSTFAWTSGNKDDDFIIQGSLYRWIMPELIKSDTMRIEFIFTDWASYRAKSDPNYPQTKAAHREYPLMSFDACEDYVSKKINLIKQNASVTQSKMIRCTDKELWRSEDEYKYFAKEETYNNGGRATKNFKTDLVAAQDHLKMKVKGVVKKFPGQVKACVYCPAFTICEQRKEYFNDDGQPV